MAAAKPVAPAFVPCADTLAIPDALPPVVGFEATLDRRGARSLVLHHGGWAGHFLCEVDGGGAARILCCT